MSKCLPFIDFRDFKAAVATEQVREHCGLLSTWKPSEATSSVAGPTSSADTAFRPAHAIFLRIHAFPEEGKKPASVTAAEFAAILA